MALPQRGRDAVSAEEARGEDREGAGEEDEAARTELDRAREHRIVAERQRSMSERLARLHHLCRQLAEVQGARER